MGKKVMSLQASLRITKKNNHESNNNKKQLNNLINVLRPKVYITNSSNFKRLVQELTGNGSSSSTMPFPPSPRRTEAAVLENNVPVIDIVDDYEDKLKASAEACSFDASADSIDFCHNIVSFIEGFREADDQMYLNDATFDISWMNDQLETDWLAYQDLESWLLDVDQPCPSIFNGFGQNQEVSIYDYKLSGLI